MLSRGRRGGGDSDDEGAAPPVNHRYSGMPGMSGSNASQYGSSSVDGRMFARSSTAPIGSMSSNLSTHSGHQPRHIHPQSASAQQGAPPSSISASNNFTGGIYGAPDMIVRASTTSNRYGAGAGIAKATRLPSCWVLDDRDRAMMSVTSTDRGNFQLGHGPTGDQTCLVAMPKGQIGNSSCLVVANNSIPVEYLKEVALKNVDQQNGTGGGALDDISASSGTIDQILSNLRSKPFGVSSTAKRATSASLYPTLPGERSSSGARDNNYRNSVGGAGSGSPTSSRKTTSSPVYYFEVTIQSMPQNTTVSVGMVVSDGHAPSGGSENHNIPGEVKNSIGLTSKGELKVSGRTMEEKKFHLEGFQVGDVIGCGLEVLGTRRILFTKNGKTLIPPTRFQDVEPKHNAYSPSIGIVVTPTGGASSSGISAVANFGARSGLSFLWEESELLHIVNTCLNQPEEKKLPASGATGTAKMPATNGNLSPGMFSGSNHSVRSEHLEHRPAPAPPQHYNFGKPSKRTGGLMGSEVASPSSVPDNKVSAPNSNPPTPSFGTKSGKGIMDEESENDASVENQADDNYRTGMSAEYPGPQQTRRAAGWVNEAQPQANQAPPPDHTAESRGRKNDSPGKTASRSKSPRGLFNFGRANKKSSQDGVTAENASPPSSDTNATSHQKTPSPSNSPVLFGSKGKKTKGGGLLDDDEEDDDMGQREFSRMPNPGAQDVPPAQRQTPSEVANLYGAMNGHAGSAPAPPAAMPSTAAASMPAPPSSSASGDAPFFGRKSKKSNLDDDNPTDIKLQNQVSSSMSPKRTQSPTNANGNGSTQKLSAGAPIPMLFGKKSKKSSLDDDNPADVQLQTAISNSFPTELAQTLSGPSVGSNLSGAGAGAASGVATSPQSVQQSTQPIMFGKKSKKSNLDDDDDDDQSHDEMQLQTNSAQVTNATVSNAPGATTSAGSFSSAGRALGVAGLSSRQSTRDEERIKNPGQPSEAPMTFGSKSKKGSLEDDDPDDDRYQSHSALPAGFNFGNPSRRKSLEDDDPNDEKYQSHSSLNASSNLGTRSKKGSLEDDDDDDDDDVQKPSHVASIPNSLAVAGSSFASRGQSNPPRSQNGVFGSKTSKSSLEDDLPSSMPYPNAAVAFGAPSKKSSLEDDDPDDDAYQNHASMFGGMGVPENDAPGNPARYQGSLPGQGPSAHAFMNNGSRPTSGPNSFSGPSGMPGSTPSESGPGQRQQMRMTATFHDNAASLPRELPESSNAAQSSSALHAPQSSFLNNIHQAQAADKSQPMRSRPPMPFSSSANSNSNHRDSANAPAPLPTSASAHQQTPGASEDDMLNAAIEESKRDQKKQELKGHMADAGPLRDPEEIETIRENTRQLRSLCLNERVDASILGPFLECCRQDQAKVQACLESDDPQVDLMEMLTLNELVLDAIKMSQKVIEGSKKKAPPTARSSKTNLNLDIGALVEKKDIFSLICILRAQSDQRLDAALALMNFAREADSLAEAGTRSLRDEIRSSGGMHSLITVFRSKGASYELRVVSALAVAYVLPSFVESSSVHPSVGLKIMECLRFLSTSRLVTPNGRRISREEMYKAAAMGVTTFWMNELTPMLNAGVPKGESTAERSDLFSRTSKKGRRKGRTGGQRHQTLELQELLEMTVSMIVQIERLGENEALRGHQTAQTDSLFLWRYTNVEQVCAVDVARPIAVREGLLPILVGWIRSKDREKVRPAVSALRYLTSIKDKYMAGWIHSQMVNEGALAEVVKLADDYYVGQDVRLAVAQILASLCVAPHTRAAVVEAKCINYLIGFLYDHSDKASQDVALFAGSAIMQLAEGAITRASVLGGGDTELQDGASPDKSDTLVDDIVNSGAIGSFIAIALHHEGKLRSMAIEAIRVLSEDTSPNRRTRSQLCEEGAAMALGRALKDGVTGLHNVMKPSSRNMGFGTQLSIDELHDALCALANILEPVQPGNGATTKLRFVSSNSDPTQNLIQGCIETAESGGLDSLLWISSLPLTGAAFSNSSELTVQRVDLLEEACRSLASLSPLLLSKEPAAQGYARCADSIFEAFDRILMMDSIDFGENSSFCSEEQYEQEAMLELNISALRGLGALADAEPLKIKIVDKTLPCLLQMRNSQGNRSDVSNVTGQVFLSLGFEEDEIAVQVAGSNPNLLADWFCLQRSLIIQAMARSEIRRMLLHIWKGPFSEVKKEGVTRLIRESNVRRTGEDRMSVDNFAENFAEVDLFESFADDDYTEHVRNSMVRQYHEFYNMGTPARSAFAVDRIENEQDEISLLARHMYPLSDTQTEIDWILGHDESRYSKPQTEPSLCINVSTPAHVEALLDCCFPSRLLRNHVVPVFSLRTDATFNFRALTMPQRKYFSFRREGQLISRLCDKQAESLDFDDVHWTLGFMNSTFAGEFSETLVQALYLCPTIRGLSFGKNEDYVRLRALDGDDDQVEDGSASLSNLVGSLPPWIHSLTFSNIFNDREVKTLVGIIETMGKLSSDQAAKASSMGGYPARGRDASSHVQTQGKFFSFAICSSPRVSPEVWYSFFSLLGKAQSLPRKAASSPLSSLKVLDLSFNNLGDDTCALLLELIHDPESGCTLEQLDLSGNGIRKGTRVLSVLRRYVEHHRFNFATGSVNDRSGWQCSLHTLNLSANNLGVGKAAVEIVTLLTHNALALKILDLSSNGFNSSNVEYELSHAIISSFEHNTVLRHFNLSNNGFSPELLDGLLSQLAEVETDCGVAFFGLDKNTPPLSVLQENCLETFLHKTRRSVLQKCLNERGSALKRELPESGAMLDPNPNNLGYQRSSDLSMIGESTVLANQESDFNKSAFDDPDMQPGDNMITVLFSAPLVFTNERRQLKPFAKLDFDMERELMWQCMKEASRDIELFFDNATHDRLLAAITKRCSCLHYSGHGHPSYLPFEDGGGGPNWFKVEDIQRLIAREGAAPFKFVFVSACHSGLAGETFASAGVPHVVCCQQEFELKDTAALAFTRQFYLSLVIGHTVRESFEQGCKAVRATPNLRDSEKEMKKFLLLPKDGNHDVPIFNAKAVLEWPKVNARQLMRSRSSKRPKSVTRIRNLHVGGARSSELGVRNMMQEDPSPTPPQFFLGREVEMYYVLKAILCKRLVSVVAEPGLGRSSLVCALCHYINERASTILAIERIYFVKAKRSRRVDGCKALMEQLLRKLVESGKEDPPDPQLVDMEDLFDFICKALKNEKALVVFDRMEYLENSDDAEEFPMLLSTLFRGTKNVKVLVTGSHPLGIPSLGGQVEYPFPLGPLTFENTLRLFANLCPHLHTAGERHKLFERLATDGEQSELRPSDSGITERTKAIFKTIGDGIPSRIEQAAYDISSDNLRELMDRYG